MYNYVGGTLASVLEKYKRNNKLFTEEELKNVIRQVTEVTNTCMFTNVHVQYMHMYMCMHCVVTEQVNYSYPHHYITHTIEKCYQTSN